MCQSYWLTESEFESPVTIYSKSDYKTYNWFDRSRFAVSEHQMSKLHTKFILFTKVKNHKIARRNPQIPSRPPNSHDLGKNPKQWERC